MFEGLGENRPLEDILLDHIFQIRFEDLPDPVTRFCKLLLMDSLGVMFPGVLAPGCIELAGLVRGWGEVSQGSTVLIHGYRTTPPMAALVNSTLMHALDFDDTFDPSALHTFVTVLPAALASCELMDRVDGRTFITALVSGVEMICRISAGIQRPLSWIRTATCGSFGAAVASAKIMGLSRGQVHNALGIVYSQTSGNAQGLLEGRLVKRMQPGFAAQAGVLSACLARSGLTGSHRFLQGPYGYFNLYEQGAVGMEAITRDLGTHFPIVDLSLKPYPCCRMTHASIDAALRIRPFVAGHCQDVQEIQVTASKMVKEMVGKAFTIGSDPQVDAQFSIPYTVSAALMGGDVFLKDFQTDAILDEKVLALAQKVRVQEDPRRPAKDIVHCEMILTLKGGESHTAAVDAPLGSPKNPLSLERCKEKFWKCIQYSGVDFGWEKAQNLLSLIEQFEDLADVKPLIHLMTAELPSWDAVKTLNLKASTHGSSKASSRRRESDLP